MDLPGELEIESFNKNTLIYWLRKLGKATSGNKPELIDRLKDFVNLEKNVPNPSLDLNLELNTVQLQEQRKIFDLSNVTWSTDLSKTPIPRGFVSDVIRDFLTSLTVMHICIAVKVCLQVVCDKRKKTLL